MCETRWKTAELWTVFQVFVFVILILSTRGRSAPLPHVLNRTNRFMLSFRGVLTSPCSLNTRCICHVSAGCVTWPSRLSFGEECVIICSQRGVESCVSSASRIKQQRLTASFWSMSLFMWHHSLRFECSLSAAGREQQLCVLLCCDWKTERLKPRWHFSVFNEPNSVNEDWS